MLHAEVFALQAGLEPFGKMPKQVRGDQRTSQIEQLSEPVPPPSITFSFDARWCCRCSAARGR
jgi:hypothetical protein